MKLQLVHFPETFVARETTYPFELVIYTNMYALVSEERWAPPLDNFDDEYRKWPYGNAWRILVLPGSREFVLVLEEHLVRTGKVVKEVET